VSNENLKRLGESLGLNAYFRLNPASQGVVPRSMMATTMEAIIGAVYLDSGKDMATTRALVNRLGI
jgi:ribonuclease-3